MINLFIFLITAGALFAVLFTVVWLVLCPLWPDEQQHLPTLPLGHMEATDAQLYLTPEEAEEHTLKWVNPEPVQLCPDCAKAIRERQEVIRND